MKEVYHFSSEREKGYYVIFHGTGTCHSEPKSISNESGKSYGQHTDESRTSRKNYTDESGEYGKKMPLKWSFVRNHCVKPSNH